MKFRKNVLPERDFISQVAKDEKLLQSQYKLIRKSTGEEVNIGETIVSQGGEKYTLMGYQFRGVGSSGRVFAKNQLEQFDSYDAEFFPHAFGLKIVRIEGDKHFSPISIDGV